MVNPNPYTWFRVNNNRVNAAGLDKIYISQSLSSRLLHSNISPVGLTENHFARSTGQVPLVFNNNLLQDGTFCLVSEQWRANTVFSEAVVGGR